MRIILSPAKTMRREEVIPAKSTPVFLKDAQELVNALKILSPEERRGVWNCSEKLAMQNEERLSVMNLNAGVSPALYSYSGLAYTNLSPESLSDNELDYLETHLRILSGLYGVLRPLDGIVPYRLEMAAKLKTATAGDLYAYWGRRPADLIYGETDTVINLASEEYSRLISHWTVPPRKMIHIIFAEESNGKLKTKGTFAKMARGQMTRWMAEEGIEDPLDIKRYERGYRFTPEASDEMHYCFIRRTGKENNE